MLYTRRQIPRRNPTVRFECAVQRTAGVAAVHVFHVLRRTRAQPHEVEVCVAGDERIERPVHRAHTHRYAQFTLQQLEAFAKVEPARFVPHCEHVRPVRHLTVAYTRDAEHEAK